MIKRLLMPAFVLLSALAGAPASAAPIAPPLASAQTAEDVGAAIKDLYTRYFAALTTMSAQPDGGKRPPEMEWEAIADSYFAPDLAARFKKAIGANEPVIDWDFFIDGQDYGDLKVVSAAATETGITAVVVMKTSNFGKESTTNVLLAKGTDGWRITDFEFWPGSDEATTLTGVLKDSGY